MSDASTPVSVLSKQIVEHPTWIVVVFLLFTAVLATGLSDIKMVGGTEQFSEDVDAYAVNENVEETFRPSFSTVDGTTLLIQDGADVLSRTELLRMLRLQAALTERPSLRVTDTTSHASVIAQELDPTATSTADQLRAVRLASDTDIRRAIRAKQNGPAFHRLVGEDFNPRSASASAAIGTVTHDTKGDEALFKSIQYEARHLANLAEGDIRVFGSGITDTESMRVIQDSLGVAIPAVVVLLLAILAIAYRDPFDIALGVLGLAMSLIWTFGFIGAFGIPFTQLQIVLPPLLIAIGVDFGIHVTNRYREEITDSAETPINEVAAIRQAIRRTVAPLAVAFFMVVTTSVIGFSANMASGLSPIADFGLVASAGIAAVTLIFAIFLPAAKLLTEELRSRTRLPSFVSTPLGTEGSLLGRLLPMHLLVTKQVPIAFLLVVALLTGMAGYYGQDVGSSFEDDDMLPPEELPTYIEQLPGPMAPRTYTATESIQTLETEFETTAEDTVTIYVQGSFSESHALESLHRASTDPPTSIIASGGQQAESKSILTVIDRYADQSPSFARLVKRSDQNGNGIPETNLKRIYERLLSSPFGAEASRYLTDDYREARIVYSVETDAADAAITADAESMADRSFRGTAVETGDVVVFQRVSEEVYRSAIDALLLALVLSLSFLTVMYYGIERRPALGLVALMPIASTVVFLVATMRYLAIPFNMLTATILSVTVGIGIDYSIHIIHRFTEELDAGCDGVTAARITLQRTGGALFGTTVTTASAGIALQYLSITPILTQFGALIALSVTYSFVASTVVLPIVLIQWAHWETVGGVSIPVLQR